MACTPDCPAVSNPAEFAAAPLARHLERVEELARDPSGHWWRNLLACRTCGQLYFHEFYEEIAWKSGADPQSVKFIPVDDRADAMQFNAMPPGRVTTDRESLRKDWPSTSDAPTAYWSV